MKWKVYYKNIEVDCIEADYKEDALNIAQCKINLYKL